ncbi:MAG TPA: autotransporter outer membrane beta-barrel domain-containing protein [Candidatus Avalokitesvara rifleensis]|uniref:autotransporter outer membrane beta-barrel domain-containing protein n=1 Tax=Candidatus Avalokitesvara rifleensis TaxID=3367620 RepID=UPI0027125607|nr:autotransporter domain-containing protein [Candidatus Brocadiales bacterium]
MTLMSNLRSKKILALALIFLSPACFISTEAMATDYTISGAQTTQQNVSTGDTVTVTGTGDLDVPGSNDGVSGESANNVTVTVQTSGKITADGRPQVGITKGGVPIRLGDGANITVQSGATVKNEGRDLNGSGDLNANAIITGANATINIAGSVLTDKQAAGYNNWSQGIAAGAGSSITVQSGGSVQSNTYSGAAVQLNSGGTLTNAGTLTSTTLDAAGYGVVNAKTSNTTITNSGTINSSDSSKEAVVFGTGGTSTGNVLNLYGSAGVTGILTNKGAAGGATVNFGYNGTSADSSANVTMTGNIGSTDNIWDGRAYGGTSTVTGSGKFNNLQTDSGSTLSFSNGVNVKDTLTNRGTLTADVTHDTADIFTLTNSGTITGAITASTAQAHSFTQTAGSIEGNVTLNGASAKTFSLSGGTITGNVDLGNSASHTVTLSGGTVTGSFDMGDTAGGIATADPGSGTTMTLSNTGGTAFTGEQSTLRMNGAGTLKITGNIVDTTGGDNDMTLDINSGTVNIVETSSIDGGIDMDGGTLSLGSNTLTVKNTTHFASNSVISPSWGSPPGKISNGSLDVAITLDDGVTFSLGRLPSSLSSNNTYTLVDATGAGGGANLTVTPANIGLSYDSLRYKLALSKGSDTLIITPSIKTIPGLSKNPQEVNQQVDSAFQDDSEMMNAINSISTASELNIALDTMWPGNKSPADLTGISLQNDAFNLVGDYLGLWRRGAIAGMGTGDEPQNKGAWGQGFYTSSHQDDKGSANGYNSHNYGFVLGIDKEVLVKAWKGLLGFAYSMGWGDVDVRNSDDSTKINSYLFGLYGSLHKDNIFFNLKGSYSLNRYKSNRFISVGSIDRHARGGYFGHQASIDADAGWEFSLKPVTIAPIIGLQYTMLYTEDFREKNAGDASLRVDSATYNQLYPRVGVSASAEFDKAGFNWKPEVSASFAYDLLNEELATDATFTGGGTSFSTDGLRPDRYKTRLSAGLTLAKGDNISFGVEYNFLFNKSYESHNGIAQFRYEF